MTSNNKILEAMQLGSKTPKAFSVVGTVLSVDTETNTCAVEPIMQAPDLMNISLMPKDPDGNVKKGFLIVPTVGSVVIVALTSPDTGFIAATSEVDEIQLNGDTYHGLVKIEDLVTKLNNLESKVNTIISTFNAHTHPYVNVATPAATSVSATPVTGTLTPTQKADLENTKVLHGNGT